MRWWRHTCAKEPCLIPNFTGKGTLEITKRFQVSHLLQIRGFRRNGNALYHVSEQAPPLLQRLMLAPTVSARPRQSHSAPNVTRDPPRLHRQRQHRAALEPVKIRRRANKGCRRVCNLPGRTPAGGHDSSASLPVHLPQEIDPSNASRSLPR
uniref:Uncharacterized protein n=1 Tax=Sphaerodactylus townsendi TaxID=933632 RepID=A0ACB8E9N9_9SAUR